MTARPSVGAAIDIGSNSVHLLVGAVDPERVRPLVDESVFLGLGSAVGTTGAFGAERRAALVDTLATFQRTATQVGARSVTLLGTEPARRASDIADAIAEVRAATGLELHVLSHEEEAYLTLIGVTGGRRLADETLVVDIGGGSSEFCVAGGPAPVRAAGLRLGSNRLTADLVEHDPATTDEVDAMRRHAAAAIAGAFPAEPRSIVLVGGTASNLLKVTRDGPSDPLLTRDRIDEAIANLSATDAATAAERFGLNLIRARILPAGAAIARAILDRYGVDRAQVSEAGIREGAILAVDATGPDWRDRSTELAVGWRA